MTGESGSGGRQAAARQPPLHDASAASLRSAAGRRLRAARLAAGLSQLALGRRIGYARQTVGEAETGGAGAAELWTRADRELAAGGDLVRLHEAGREASAAEAAAAARAGTGPALPPAPPPGCRAAAAVAAEGSCPHCGCLLTVRTRLAAAITGPLPAGA